MRSNQTALRVLALLSLLFSVCAPMTAARADDGPPPATPTPAPDGPAGSSPAGPGNFFFATPPTGCDSQLSAISSTTQMAINDHSTITSTINVSSNSAYIWNVQVGVAISHSYNADLDIHLISPAGTDIVLADKLGGQLNNVFSGTTFYDQAALTDNAGLPITDFANFVDGVATPTLNPQEPLGALRGQNPGGAWKLVVHDGSGGDTGRLMGWTLIFQTLSHAPDVVTSRTAISPGPSTIGNGGTVLDILSIAGLADPISAITLTTVITHPQPGKLELFLVSPGGVTLTLSTGNGLTNTNAFAGTRWDDRAGATNAPGPVTLNQFASNVVESPLAPEEGLNELLGGSASGTWHFRVDDLGGGGGKLGRVTLVVQTAHCFPNLKADIETAPSYARLGQSATITFSSSNLSVAASNVTLAAKLDPQLRFQALNSGPWLCNTPPVNSAGAAINCSTPSQATLTTLNLVVTVTTPLVPGYVPISMTLGLSGPDTNPANNQKETTVSNYAFSQNKNPWDVDTFEGYVDDGGQDAFDEFGGVRLEVLVGSSLTFTNDGGDFGLLFSGPGQQQRWSSSKSEVLGNIRYSRQLWAPSNQNWLRYVDTFHNESGSARTLYVSWGGNLGSDQATYPAATSSGNQIIDASDTWAVTQQDPPGSPAGDAVVGYAFRSAGDTSYQGPDIFSASEITTTYPITGEEYLGHLFTFTLAPGATKRLAYFVYRGLAENDAGPLECLYYGGCVTPATGAEVTLAQTVVAGLVAQPPLCDLSPVERASLVNWTNLAGVCHDAFLPVTQR